MRRYPRAFSPMLVARAEARAIRYLAGVVALWRAGRNALGLALCLPINKPIHWRRAFARRSFLVRFRRVRSVLIGLLAAHQDRPAIHSYAQGVTELQMYCHI
jgi:hypothetical protein